MQEFVSSKYLIGPPHTLRFFSVAADSTPDMIRKNFSNQIGERGGKPMNFDGPELAKHDLNILSLFKTGMPWNEKILGVAMSRTRPGQAEDALVIYFTLAPRD